MHNFFNTFAHALWATALIGSHSTMHRTAVKFMAFHERIAAQDKDAHVVLELDELHGYDPAAHNCWIKGVESVGTGHDIEKLQGAILTLENCGDHFYIGHDGLNMITGEGYSFLWEDGIWG